MSADEERVEELRRSLNEATKKVQGWPQAKTLSATATVDSKRLASYYESPLPTCRDGKAT
jgi:hypothetical protein